MDKLESGKQILAKKLIEARKYSGLSQGQVAKIFGYHRPTISEIEGGRRNVSTEELVKFTEIYKVSINWLTSTEESNESEVKVEFAARELAKLKKNDLDKVLNLLSMLRDS